MWAIGALIALGGAVAAWMMTHERPAAPREVAIEAPVPPADALARPTPAATSMPAIIRPTPITADRTGLVDDAPVQLPAPGGVPVKVVDGATHAPVPGADVYAASMSTLRAAVKDRPGFDSSVNVMRVMQSRGMHFRTDAAGATAVPSADLMLVARLGDQVGSWGMNRRAPDGIVIELRPDVTLSARVVDADGRPAIGVPVGCFVSEADRLMPRAGGESTAPDGVVRFDGLAAFEPLAADARIVLAPVHVPLPECRVEATVGELREHPPTIRLGPTGSVVVQVWRADGSPLREPSPVLLTVNNRGEKQATPLARNYLTWCMTDGAGRARFVAVAIGLPIEASVVREGCEPVKLDADGPATAGAEVAVTLKLGPEPVHVRGRVLDAERRPLANWALRAQLRNADGAEISRGFFTDDDGRFDEAVTAESRPEGRMLTVALDARRAPSTGAATVPVPAPAENGVCDVGDVVIAPLPLIASGRVVDDSGAPAKGAVVSLVSRRPPNEPVHRSASWNRWTTGPWDVGADGTFEVRGNPPDGELALVASGDSFVHSDRVSFAAGARDLEIVVGRAATVRGLLVLPSGWSGREFAVRIEYGSPRAAGEPRKSAPLQVFEDGRFESVVAPPGTGSLIVAASASSDEVLVRIDEIVLAPGVVCSDPRLARVSLRDAGLFITVRGRDEAGLAIPFRVDYRTATNRRPSPDWPRSSGKDGSVHLAFAGFEPRRLRVTADGRRDVTLEDVTADCEAVLRRGIPITIHVTKVPDFGEDVRVRITAGPAAGGSAITEALDEHGSASCVLARSGSVELTFSVLLGQGYQIAYRHPPIVVEVVESSAPQLFEVALTDEIRQALTEAVKIGRASQKK